MLAPTIAQLLNEPIVVQALEDAWQDSMSNDPAFRHEEGGWIYAANATGDLVVRRARAGQGSMIDLNLPPIVTGAVVVATFHTHPNPSADGWDPGPSPGDTQSALILGVPCLIRADNGVQSTGPNSRRGGMAGGPGFPP